MKYVHWNVEALRNEDPRYKILLTGTKDYENKSKIRDVIYKLKARFGTDIIIVSPCANIGADKYIKKYTIDFGLRLGEFNPAHDEPSIYSVMPEQFFNQPYHGSQFSHRDDLMVSYCDSAILFINTSTTDIKKNVYVKLCKKKNKQYAILDEKA